MAIVVNSKIQVYLSNGFPYFSNEVKFEPGGITNAIVCTMYEDVASMNFKRFAFSHKSAIARSVEPWRSDSSGPEPVPFS